MSRTKPLLPEDLQFIERFSKKLQQKYRQYQGSDEEFAKKLDVSRPALKKYIDGAAMPGIRTVALAYENLNINVRYGKFEAKLLHQRGSSRGSVEAQLLLPFAIESLKKENVEIELVDKKPNRIAMNVSIRFAG